VGRSIRLLVVDDHQDTAASMAALLRIKFGCRTRVAHDANSALAIAASFRPELVLLDLGLPEVADGMAVARHLSELKPRPLVIALTGWAGETLKEQAGTAAIDDYILKPASSERLGDAVEEARRRGARRPRRAANRVAIGSLESSSA
jgi:DNA-binding response OmpR family regulator